jgi:hypothetical protein
MELTGGAHLAYLVEQEAWYWKSIQKPAMKPDIIVRSAVSGQGCIWEFTIEDDGSGQVIMLIYSEAFRAFAEIPEFFAAMARTQPGNLAGVRTVLDYVGAADETMRTKP